jgi:hypothetical protein
MNPVEPRPHCDGAVIIDVAKNQTDKYVPLRVSVNPADPHRTFVTEWELTAEELAALVNGGRVKLSVLTFGQKLQPVMLEVVEP